MIISNKAILMILSVCCLVLLGACSNDNSSSMPPSSVENGANKQTESNTKIETESLPPSTNTGGNPSESGTVSREIRIRLTFSGGETVAELQDNPATRSLLTQLPITVTLVFFYKDQPYANGIIPMGRVESGLEKLSAMNAGFEVKIERLK